MLFVCGVCVEGHPFGVGRDLICDGDIVYVFLEGHVLQGCSYKDTLMVL